MDGDRVEIKVNKLTSTVTQLPYDYYKLAFCRPDEIVNSVENLGEVLHGSVIQNSPYELFAQKADFKVLCKRDLTEKEAKLFAQRVKEVRRATAPPRRASHAPPTAPADRPADPPADPRRPARRPARRRSPTRARCHAARHRTTGCS
jgi:hypothetical protein